MILFQLNPTCTPSQHRIDSDYMTNQSEFKPINHLSESFLTNQLAEYSPTKHPVLHTRQYHSTGISPANADSPENDLYRTGYTVNGTNESKSPSLNSQAESGDETGSQTSSGSPVQARLVADGVSVLYSAPAPPLIPPHHTNFNHEQDHEFTSGLEEEERDEFDEFLEKVKSASPIRRCETSSASLPVSWYSSRDSMISPHQPNSLQSDDYAPQIMTEDYVASPQPSTQSSLSSSAFYTTFLPDRDLNSSEVGGLDLEDSQVGIVENEYTIVEYSDPSCQEDEDVYWAERREEGTSTAESLEPRIEERNWKSNSGLADIKDFWEKKVPKNQQYVKYASDSNICEMSGAPENGLRNIPKDKDFSSRDGSESSERSGFEDHIYCRIDEVQEPRYPAPGFQESGFFSYDQYGYYDNVIPEEPSDYEDSLLEPEHVSRVPVRSQSEWQVNEKNDSQLSYSDGVNLPVKPRPSSKYTDPKQAMAKSVASELEQLANRRPVKSAAFLNGHSTPKDHVTLITIGSDPPPTIPSKPAKLRLKFNQEPQFGSVNDLRRAFEEGRRAQESRGTVNLNPNPTTNSASARVKEDMVILTFSGILSSLWLG